MMNEQAEHPEPNAARRESMLFKASKPVRQTSPDAMRQSFMVLIAFAAFALSGYYTATLSGTSAPRLIMAALSTGWFVLMVHSFGGFAPISHRTTRRPGA